MKKTLVAVTALALLLTLLCGQALAVTGDITTKPVKAYADAEMTKYIGTIPAYTSLLVRSYDTFADVYLEGKLCYINASALLRKDIASDYLATLKKGTKVYQNASTEANYKKLAKSTDVKLCGFNGGWALVRSTGSKGVYAFVKLTKLTNIREK